MSKRTEAGFEKYAVGRKPKLAASYERARMHFGPHSSAALTDYDGAVLLMVLAGLYDR